MIEITVRTCKVTNNGLIRFDTVSDSINITINQNEVLIKTPIKNDRYPNSELIIMVNNNSYIIDNNIVKLNNPLKFDGISINTTTTGKIDLEKVKNFINPLHTHKIVLNKKYINSIKPIKVFFNEIEYLRDLIIMKNNMGFIAPTGLDYLIVGNVVNTPISVDVGIISKDEGSGIGYVPKYINRTHYTPIGKGSLDLSIGDNEMDDKGVSGRGSLALGYNIKSSGFASITTGWDNYNIGKYNIMNGISNTAHSSGCIINGVGLDSGDIDLTMLIGSCNIKPLTNSYSLIIGNGTTTKTKEPTKGIRRVYERDKPSDSFRVYRSGRIEAPSLLPTMITHKYDLITKEFFDLYTTEKIINDKGYGIVLTSSNGIKYQLSITNNGELNIIQIK